MIIWIWMETWKLFPPLRRTECPQSEKVVLKFPPPPKKFLTARVRIFAQTVTMMLFSAECNGPEMPQISQVADGKKTPISDCSSNWVDEGRCARRTLASLRLRICPGKNRRKTMPANWHFSKMHPLFKDIHGTWLEINKKIKTELF